MMEKKKKRTKNKEMKKKKKKGQASTRNSFDSNWIFSQSPRCYLSKDIVSY